MRTMIVLAGLLCAPMLTHADSPLRHMAPSISVSAQGETSIAPDQASIHIAVITRALTATEAGKENARVSTAVQQALRKAGVEKDLMRTANYSLQPDIRYERDQQRLAGYIATNTLHVRVTDMGNVGRVIDQATQAGANHINAIQFESSKAAEARQTALTRAIERARGDAEAMARAAGGKLGALIELSTEQLIPEPMHRMESMTRMQDSATPIAPGEITVEARVLGRWAFVPR
jgi:uncharacterized protein